MKPKYERLFALLMMLGLFACDEKSDAKSGAETATASSTASAGDGATTTTKSKPAEAPEATCAAVVDKLVSLAPKEESASARELWTGMCEELTEDQRKCVLGANGTGEVDKCVDAKE